MTVNISNPFGFICGALVAACITTALNEFIFLQPIVSFPVAIITIALCAGLAIFNKYRSLVFCIIFIFFTFATRPRSLHLVPIEDRGNYAFFSPNMVKIFGPTASTTMVFIVFVVVIMRLLRKSRFPINKKLAPIYLFTILILVVTLVNAAFFDKVGSLALIISDLKYPIFIITGYLLVYQARVSKDDLIRYIIFIGLTLGISAVILFYIDISTGKLLLNYNPNVYFSIIALGYFLVYFKFTGISSYLIFITIALGAFPIIRGEQLVFAITLLTSLLIMFSSYKSQNKILKTLSIISILAGFAFYLLLNDNTLTQFFYRKIAIFMTGNFSIDQSSMVRFDEFIAIVTVKQPSDLFQLLFGTGFGGTFSFNESVSYQLGLADYSMVEISNNQFSQPHLFLTYLLLKYGVFGTFFFIFSLQKMVVGTKMQLILIFIALPALLWQGYWSPGYAILTGILLGATGLQTTREKQFKNNEVSHHY